MTRDLAIERIRFNLYVRHGYILRIFSASTHEAQKYSPNQPREPAGRPTGGRWVRYGSDGNESAIPDIYEEPIRPVYPIETVLCAVTAGQVGRIVRYLMSVYINLTDERGDKYSSVINAIEEYFRGELLKFLSNKAGDKIIMGKDKKIRFDINGATGDEPHFHIERRRPNGDWVDAGTEHRYYFKNKE